MLLQLSQVHLLKGENGNSFCIQSFANRADEVKVHDDGSFPERGVVLPRGARDRFELKVLTIRRQNQFFSVRKKQYLCTVKEREILFLFHFLVNLFIIDVEDVARGLVPIQLGLD